MGVDITPEDLLAAHPGAVAHERTIETDQKSLAAARDRGLEGGWGAGALLERDGAVLLVRQDGQWFLPGGQVEGDETLDAAAERELREETGLTVQVGDLIAVSQKTLVSGDDTLTFQFATFGADLAGGGVTDDPGLPDEEIDTVEWHETLPPNTYDRDLVARLRT